MKSDVESLNPTRVKLTVAVTFDEFKPSVDKAYKEISQQVNIPGFRKGKVPPPIIDKRVGQGAVLQEAINDALPTFYSQAAHEHKIVPVSEPDVEVTGIPDLKDGGEFGFTIEVDVRPTITVPEDLSSFEVTVDDVEIDEEKVDEELTTLRQRFGTLVGVDRPAQTGDFVSVNLKATIGDEEIEAADGISYEIGSGNLLEGIDEALDGLSADESTVFKAPLRGGEHAGKDADIAVDLVTVKERELPELDDEFAQMASEFDTVDELKDSVRDQVENMGKMQQIADAQEAFLEQLRESMDIPVPESMVKNDVENHLRSENRTDDDEHRAEVTKETELLLQRQFILDALAEREDVQVTQEELINHLVATAPQYGMDPQSFANAVQEADQMQSMVVEVGRRKALLLALSDATVKNAAGDVIDLGLVEETEEDDDAATNEAPTADADTSADEPQESKKGSKDSE